MASVNLEPSRWSCSIKFCTFAIKGNILDSMRNDAACVGILNDLRTLLPQVRIEPRFCFFNPLMYRYSQLSPLFTCFYTAFFSSTL